MVIVDESGKIQDLNDQRNRRQIGTERQVEESSGDGGADGYSRSRRKSARIRLAQEMADPQSATMLQSSVENVIPRGRPDFKDDWEEENFDWLQSRLRERVYGEHLGWYLSHLSREVSRIPNQDMHRAEISSVHSIV
jgi:hypothetical protein